MKRPCDRRFWIGVRLSMSLMAAVVMCAGGILAQGTPCDDYTTGDVVPFANWAEPFRCAQGGTAHLRIFKSYSDDGVGVEFFDASDPFHPVYLYGEGAELSCDVFGLNDRRFRIVTWGEYGGGGVDCIVEIGEGGVSRFNIMFSIPVGTVKGNQHYLWHERSYAGFRLYDAADLNSVIEIDPPPGMIMPSLVLEELAFQHIDDNWTIVDLMAMGGPVLRGSFVMPGRAISVSQCVDDVLYMAFTDSSVGSVWSLDLADLDHPAVLSTLNDTPRINNIAIQDGLLYNCTVAGISIYDVADPSRFLSMSGLFGIGESCIQVVPRGHLLYARFTSCLAVYDIADPTEPALLGSVPLDGIEKISCLRLDLVAAEHWLVTGKDFLHFDCNDPLPLEDDEQASAPPPTGPLSVSASQALQRAPEIRFSLDRPGEADLSVYDMLGRRLSTLVSTTLPVGPHLVTWDGRDGSGRTQPAGVYLARLRLDDRTATCKLTLIK